MKQWDFQSKYERVVAWHKPKDDTSIYLRQGVDLRTHKMGLVELRVCDKYGNRIFADDDTITALAEALNLASRWSLDVGELGSVVLGEKNV